MRNPFKRSQKPADFNAPNVVPDAGRTSYFGTSIGTDPEDIVVEEYDVFDGWEFELDSEAQIGVTVVEDGLHVGYFEYDSIQDFADAIRAYGELYATGNTVTLVLTRL